MQRRFSGSILILAALCAGAGGCSRSEAPAQDAKATATSQKSSYEIVTIDRPASVADYHRPYVEAYKACAIARTFAGMGPPPPMKQPPADFIVQRDTYISDGSAYYSKREDFSYIVIAEGERPSCETRAEKSTITEVLRDGKVYHASVDDGGQARTEAPEEAPPARRPSDAVYTESRVAKGHALKCMKLLPGMEKALTEQCTLDLQPGTVYYNGEPIIVTNHTILPGKLGAVLTEPVTVKIGQQVDRSVFDAAGKP